MFVSPPATGYAQMVSLACHWLELTESHKQPEEREKNRDGVALNELFFLEQVRFQCWRTTRLC